MMAKARSLAPAARKNPMRRRKQLLGWSQARFALKRACHQVPHTCGAHMPVSIGLAPQSISYLCRKCTFHSLPSAGSLHTPRISFVSKHYPLLFCLIATYESTWRFFRQRRFLPRRVHDRLRTDWCSKMRDKVFLWPTL